jgi:hypothetical protein
MVTNTCNGCDCETPCTINNYPFPSKEAFEQFDKAITGIDKTKCRDCGGKGQPSTGYINQHNIRKSYLRGEVEFETKLVACLKCEDCGHSWA